MIILSNSTEKFSTENLQYLVLGDLNVDFKQLAKSSCGDKLDEIFVIYGIHQLINE